MIAAVLTEARKIEIREVFTPSPKAQSDSKNPQLWDLPD